MDYKTCLYNLETIAFKAWPASIKQTYGSWIIRSNDGVTKRANSVFTLGEIPNEKTWLKDIEKTYKEHSHQSCFYISELTPIEVDAKLRAHHYLKEGEMYLMKARSKRVRNLIKKRKDICITYCSEVKDQWIYDFLRLESYSKKLFSAYKQIFTNIKLNKCFITIRQKNSNEVVALGTIATDRGWGYLSNIVVNEKVRRQGLALQLLRALASWGIENGATHLFLQVLKSNKPALKLYERLQFQYVSSSHYRVKEINRQSL